MKSNANSLLCTVLYRRPDQRDRQLTCELWLSFSQGLYLIIYCRLSWYGVSGLFSSRLVCVKTTPVCRSRFTPLDSKSVHLTGSLSCIPCHGTTLNLWRMNERTSINAINNASSSCRSLHSFFAAVAVRWPRFFLKTVRIGRACEAICSRPDARQNNADGHRVEGLFAPRYRLKVACCYIVAAPKIRGTQGDT